MPPSNHAQPHPVQDRRPQPADPQVWYAPNQSLLQLKIRSSGPFLVISFDTTAVQLLQLIEERFFLASIGADYRVSITSALPTTYRQSQQILSNRLAEDHPALAYELLTETTRRADRAPKVRWLGNPAPANRIRRTFILAHAHVPSPLMCLSFLTPFSPAPNH